VSDRKPYGHLPRQLRPYLPRLVDQLRDDGIKRSPYRVLADVFEVSPGRVEQIVLAERKHQKLREQVDEHLTQPPF
jgi:hypothetical protein